MLLIKFQIMTINNCLNYLKEDMLSLLKEELGRLYSYNPQEGWIEVSFTQGCIERGTFDFLFVAGNCCSGIVLPYNQKSIQLIKRWFANMANNPFNEEACQKRRERMAHWSYLKRQHNPRFCVEDYYWCFGNSILCDNRIGCESPKEAICMARKISEEFGVPVRIYLAGGSRYLEVEA